MATPLRFAFWTRAVEKSRQWLTDFPQGLKPTNILQRFTARLKSCPDTKRRFPGTWKAAEAAVLAVAICFSLGSSAPTSRLNTLSHHLMCQCGCAQVLGECDHVGCPDRDKELAELSSAIDSGLGDQQILDAFAAKYGETVLAAPRTTGFDLVAWIAPFAVFAAALLGTILLIRRWGGLGRKAQTAAAGEAAALDPAEMGPAEQERMERIRRETGSDGGF
jgi:cytochrome c-type biogenesis protein CcmH